MVYDPYYKARKSGKLIADFSLATHDKKGATRYWRIRAFDETARRVRDTVRKGQTGVEAVVYGPNIGLTADYDDIAPGSTVV